jgi:hypothetical protein
LGRYIPRIIYPLSLENCYNSYVEIEPFSCVHNFGIRVRVISERITGLDENRTTYAKVIYENYITQSCLLDENYFTENFVDLMEAFYYNKCESQIAIPLFAILMRIYFPELIVEYGLDVSDYIGEVEYEEERRAGFQLRSDGQED